jgi:hypothetical protein
MVKIAHLWRFYEPWLCRAIDQIPKVVSGDLLEMPLPAGDHFYNRIEGYRYDFTASQFDWPIAYGHAHKSGRRGAGSDKRLAG